VNVQSQAVLHLLSQGQTGVASEHLARLISVAQEAHVDAREYIADVKAAGSLERGFLPTLEEYAKRFSATFGIPVGVVTSPNLAFRILDPTGEVQLLRIIQEALANTRKHACAHRASISVTTDEHWAQVVIEDNGRGFDLTTLSVDGESYGLRSMRERAALLGGSLEVFSQPGQGTRVVVRAPVIH
jgi:signal transduction histidine kinase